MAVRPTADRTREALFNILAQGKLPWRPRAEAQGNPLIGIDVLDAFAGTGALGLEALSRGAGHVTFMENQAVALAACRNNIRLLEETGRCQVLHCDVLRPPPATAPCALVLMDPPYNQDLAPPALGALEAAGWLEPGALAAVELMAKEPFTPLAGFKARLVFLRAPG